MIKVSVEDLTTLMNQAVHDKLCVSSWLGYADVLLLGFGDRVLPLPIRIEETGQKPRFLHPASAPYRLQSGLADWWVYRQSRVVGSSEDDPDADLAAATLVGKRVIGWKFVLEGCGLCINFEEELRVVVLPYPDNEADEVWNMSDPDGCFFIMHGDNRIIKRHGTERPVR